MYERQLRKKVQIPFSVWSLHVLLVWVLLRLSSTVQGRFDIIPIKLRILLCLVERSSPGNECVLSLTHESRSADVKWMKFFTNPISSQAIMCNSELDISWRNKTSLFF